VQPDLDDVLCCATNTAMQSLQHGCCSSCYIHTQQLPQASDPTLHTRAWQKSKLSAQQLMQTLLK
jgi:hypothetical protein